MVQPHELLGTKFGDPADVLACMHDRFIVLPPGVSPYDWGALGRLIPNPPSIEGAPFTEIRLARTPEAAWVGEILRRVASGEQPIWQILKDVRLHSIHRIEAPGARIKDCHSDSKMVGGPRALRKEGEAHVHEGDRSLVALGGGIAADAYAGEKVTSHEWRAIDRLFHEPIAAVVLPDDSPHPTIRPDWPLIGSIPRLELLEDEALKLVYLGDRTMKMRDLLSLTDAAGKPAGLRFGYFLARELAHDFFSPQRKRSLRDWFTLAGAVLTFTGGVATLASRLIDLLL